MDELKKLPNLTKIQSEANSFDYPIPIEIVEKFGFYHIYGAAIPKNKGNNVYARFRSYEFQKMFLTKFPDRIQDLKPFGFHERIKEEFAALIRGDEWGFFDLKENKLNEEVEEDEMFLDPTYFDYDIAWIMEDLNQEELICSEEIENDYYKVYLLNEYWPSDMAGKFILVYIDDEHEVEICDYFYEIDSQERWETYVNAVKNIVKKMQSYEVQKNFLEKHPNKAASLKPFGYHEEIRKEYPALVRGSEWGFFDLEK